MAETSEQLRILIADDNDTDRMILQAIISSEGYTAITAKNGLEAVEIYQAENPDIILMDAIMPELDGMQAAKIIKSASDSKFVPILFLTSLHDPKSLAACLESGGDDFLSKPYNPLILKAKINASIRLRDMHNQLHLHNQNMQVEQQIAKSIFDKVAHLGRLDRSNIRYLLSPKSVFNGDTLLSASRPDGGLNFFIGDFTGHGLSAAIGTIPLAEVFYGMTARGYQITDIIREINEKLYRYLPTNFFCAAAMVELDNVNQQVQIWLGGLPDIVLYQPETQSWDILQSNHLPLGVVGGESFNVELYHRTMNVGDQLFLWSDGLHEAMNAKEELFGESRVMSVFEQASHSDEIFDQLLENLELFVGDKEKKDDITLLAVTMDKPDHSGLMSLIRDSQTKIVGSQDWSMEYRLFPSSMKSYSPIPFLLNALLEVDELKSIGNLLYTVLTELYSNALEHGLLKLDSELKKSPEGFTKYYQEREARLSELKIGEIIISFKHRINHDGGKLSISFEDSGEGFNYKKFMLESKSNRSYSGRGLHLLEKITDSLKFKKKGCHIIAQLSWYNNLISQ